MAYYLILRGPLGIGKSTVARNLAEKIGAEYISLDHVLSENHLDTVDPNQGCISPEQFIAANKTIFPKIKESLEQGKIVILDGNFYHQSQISDLVTNLPFPYLAFTLKASLETCITRDRGREKSYGEDAARAVHSLVSRFDYGTIIDTDHRTSDEVIKDIISCLPKH